MSDTPPMSRREARESQHRPEGAAPESQTTPEDAVLDDLFTGRATTDAIGSTPPPVGRRRKRRNRWIALVVVVALVGGVAAGAIAVWNTYEDQIRSVMGWEEPKDYEAGIAEGETTITIVSGDNGRTISSTLYNAGVTKTDEVFYDYLIDEGLNPSFQPGVFRLQLKMTAAAALAALEDPANRRENTVQLREGLTLTQTLSRTSEALGIPLEELESAASDPSAFGVDADSLEGWLFPATYTFGPDVTATEALQTYVDRAVQSLDAAGVPAPDRQRILTIASIIEREARFQADFFKVSRVIANRLDDGMLLQMDSTAQYGYGTLHDGTVSSGADALSDDNPWNTYVIEGLPAGPIANPGDLAIDAAMHPADGPWLYFVTVNLDTGETLFTTSYEDHQAGVAQWRAWCTENPDSGC